MKGKLRLNGIFTVLMMLALVCVPMVGKAMAADLELDDQEGQLEGQVTFTLSVNNAPNEVTSLGVDIGYDHTVLEYVGGTGDFSGTLLEPWSFKQVSNPAPGLLRLGGFTVQDAIAPGASGNLVKLAFVVIGTADSQLPLSELKDGIAGWSTKDGTFTYLLPTITGVNPDSGSTLGDQPVTITGTNFFELAQPPTVTFGGAGATAVAVVSPTEITCLTPPHPEGIVDVVVTNPDSKSATLPQSYEYVEFAIDPSIVTPCEGASVIFTVVPQEVGIPPFTWRVNDDIVKTGDFREFEYMFMEAGDFIISVEDSSVPALTAQAAVTVLAEDDSGALDIMAERGSAGDTVIIKIQIQNAPNEVASLGVDIGFDQNVLEYSSADFAGTLMEAWSFKGVSNPYPGLLRLGGFTVEGAIAPGASGILVKLTFTVNPDLTECVSSFLELEELKDDIREWSASGSCFLAECGCDGDVNRDGEITPMDALCAFEAYLLIDPTSCGIPIDEVCGDVNRDGEITPADALCIFQKYLLLPSCLD